MAKTRKRSDSALVEAEPAASQPESPQSRPEVSSNGAAERIAARAYELYLARGGAHGHDWDDWLAAERELAQTRPNTEER
jgi:hypothetical protein